MNFKTKAGRNLLLFSLVLLAACSKEPAPDKPELNENDYYKIKIIGKIKIGQIVYDSISARFIVKAFNGDKVIQSETFLPSGLNQLFLPKNATKYSIIMNKWGTSASMELDAVDVKENTPYSIIANKEAKLLKEELIYDFSSGTYQLRSKVKYSYNGNTLNNVVSYGFTAGQFELIKKEQFFYDTSSLVKIKETYLNNSPVQPYERIFSYNPYNQISKTEVSFPITNYAFLNDYIPGRNSIRISTQGINNPSGLHFYLQFSNGNLSERTTIMDDGDYSDIYNYDENINPYIHLNWPDLLFSRQSNNNIKVQKYRVDDLVSEEVKYEYQYDLDGYPSQVIKEQRDSNGAFVIKEKKQFVY
ncbi:MAG: hypothetical protein QM737_15010 [Ferruginibacter sp.]